MNRIINLTQAHCNIANNLHFGLKDHLEIRVVDNLVKSGNLSDLDETDYYYAVDNCPHVIHSLLYFGVQAPESLARLVIENFINNKLSLRGCVNIINDMKSKNFDFSNTFHGIDANALSWSGIHSIIMYGADTNVRVSLEKEGNIVKQSSPFFLEYQKRTKKMFRDIREDSLITTPKHEEIVFSQRKGTINGVVFADCEIELTQRKFNFDTYLPDAAKSVEESKRQLKNM